MLKLETILKDTLWVAKMHGWRECGTYAEIEELAESAECREIDIAAQQPEHLKEFYDLYFAYDRQHGFITVQDFYYWHYAPAMNEREEEENWK